MKKKLTKFSCQAQSRKIRCFNRKFGEKIIGHENVGFLTIGLMYCPLSQGEHVKDN